MLCGCAGAAHCPCQLMVAVVPHGRLSTALGTWERVCGRGRMSAAQSRQIWLGFVDCLVVGLICQRGVGLSLSKTMPVPNGPGPHQQL